MFGVRCLYQQDHCKESTGKRTVPFQTKLILQMPPIRRSAGAAGMPAAMLHAQAADIGRNDFGRSAVKGARVSSMG